MIKKSKKKNNLPVISANNKDSPFLRKDNQIMWIIKQLKRIRQNKLLMRKQMRTVFIRDTLIQNSY